MGYSWDIHGILMRSEEGRGQTVGDLYPSQL